MRAVRQEQLLTSFLANDQLAGQEIDLDAVNGGI